MPSIRTKRVYEKPAAEDGTRVLVERLWPRGLTKAKARIDLWLKDVAPSPELRKWYGHDVVKWAEFKKRYRAELRKNLEASRTLRRLANDGPLTLVYAARDEEHNSALVLEAFLSGKRRIARRFEVHQRTHRRDPTTTPRLRPRRDA